MMQTDTTFQAFASLRARYFDPLCQKLGLQAGEPEVGRGFAMVSASAGPVRVYLEYEWGLCSFALGPNADPKPLCSVEGMAERFPRTRLLSEGQQRLSLEEQLAFLKRRWNDLRVMFSAEHLAETRRWRAAVAAALTKRFSRKT